MKCSELFSIIDKSNEKYLDMLEEVCNVESPTSYKKGVDNVGEYFMEIARNHNWSIEISKQDVSGDAICITMNKDAKGEQVSLSGHMDTVYPVGLFGVPAVKRDDKNMYGPGVMDCKGGIVAAVMAMDALEKVGFISRPVQLILQSDEENSSMTSNKKTIEFMCKKAKNSIAFLNLEGIKENTATITRKGILRYRFIIRGKALHSARCAEGANAVAEAAYKIIELEKMKNPKGLTCNCGVIKGGTTPNTVAEECEFLVDIRFATEKELEGVKKKVLEVAEKTTVEGCSCKFEELSFRPAMEYSEKNVKLLEKMNEIYKENGLPNLTGRECPSGSDAAYITKCGIPCLDSLGTEGYNIHSRNEYIRMDSLSECAKRIAALIYCI